MILELSVPVAMMTSSGMHATLAKYLIPMGARIPIVCSGKGMGKQ